MWLLMALLGAVFAAITSILAKIGIEGVNSNLATAIRTVVVLIFAWGLVLIDGSAKGLPALTTKTWIFLGLSGVATGLSWLFYFRALQLGKASAVVPIDKLSLVLSVILAVWILREKMTLAGWIGVGMMSAGAILIAVGK